jgi:TniQ
MSFETEPDLWPIRPRPFPGEVFTGWVARIAQAHGLAPTVLLAHFRARFSLAPTRDLDTDPSYELIAEVSHRTALTYSRVVRMTLRWHAHPWYAREARNHHGSFGFCSCCWTADSVPYIRRAWRLPWMPCLDHRIPLRWRCPQCKGETRIEVLGPVPPIHRCLQCDVDLRFAAPAQWPRTVSRSEIAGLLHRCQQEFENVDARYRIPPTG